MVQNNKGPFPARTVRSASNPGLLEDGAEWDAFVTEVAAMRTERSPRQIFAVLLHTCELSVHVFLWGLYKKDLSEDFIQHG